MREIAGGLEAPRAHGRGLRVRPERGQGDDPVLPDQKEEVVLHTVCEFKIGVKVGKVGLLL